MDFAAEAAANERIVDAPVGCRAIGSRVCGGVAPSVPFHRKTTGTLECRRRVPASEDNSRSNRGKSVIRV
jgi:hypothetical protein